ncbi:NmrA family protein [Streptomyces spiroverticillatus]|uniref:NmrA family protein n=1 Tax=Streptomyces finlayi TaxID=67296 RepID=A0A919CF48_9ACTN|nr:NAD(P)H-binding protein [Streptomyces finlayi]GHA30283.1 NmrA family protein [Streptomyces spiroverticillatus]GHD14960.1 NmrA family protein [Streptomyces finlayi]
MNDVHPATPHAPVLVLGARGSTGRRVAALLRDAHHPVRAASRNCAVTFDWHDDTTWEPALTGADRLYLMLPHELPLPPDFVRRAVASGVRRLVLLSSRAVEEMGDDRLIAAEELVRACGVDWTVVRADWFNQNFDEGVFREAVLDGTLALPLGECRQTFVDADDIAAVAAAALTEDGHAGRTYEVTGPEALSFADALALIGSAADLSVAFRGDQDSYRAVGRSEGRPAKDVEREIDAYAALVALGDSHPTDTVHRVTGRPPKRFALYAKEAAAKGGWSRRSKR